MQQITPEGLLLNGARAAGEKVVQFLTKKRLKTHKSNPFQKGIASNQAVLSNGSNNYSGKIESSSQDLPLYTSELGTSVYSDVTFESVTYTDRTGKSITTPQVKYQAILISLSFPRNIVKTEIQGKDGTVKEYIGEGDAQISFRGVITGTNGSYPSNEVEKLKKVIKAPVAIPVTCIFLNDKDIYNIVFEDRTLDQEEGGYSYQTFVLQAISDTPQEFLISGN